MEMGGQLANLSTEVSSKMYYDWCAPASSTYEFLRRALDKISTGEASAAAEVEGLGG